MSWTYINTMAEIVSTPGFDPKQRVLVQSVITRTCGDRMYQPIFIGTSHNASMCEVSAHSVSPVQMTFRFQPTNIISVFMFYGDDEHFVVHSISNFRRAVQSLDIISEVYVLLPSASMYFHDSFASNTVNNIIDAVFDVMTDLHERRRLSIYSCASVA